MFRLTEATKIITASTCIFSNDLMKFAITIAALKAFQIIEWHCDVLSSIQDDRNWNEVDKIAIAITAPKCFQN